MCWAYLGSGPLGALLPMSGNGQQMLICVMGTMVLCVVLCATLIPHGRAFGASVAAGTATVAPSISLTCCSNRILRKEASLSR